MGFYDLSKEKRLQLTKEIGNDILQDILNKKIDNILKYASDEDTYIRKTCYMAIGRLYFANINLQTRILFTLNELIAHNSSNARQTAVNAFGEIGKKEPEKSLKTFEQALMDNHHSVRNAVIGSLKKMGEKKPEQVIKFAKKFIHHPDPEIRRQVLHGIELRGRTHPEDILPLLKEMEFEKVARVRNIIIHVIGQISYKEGCLEKVIKHLTTWKNEKLIEKCLKEIMETHEQYPFAVKTPVEASTVIKQTFPNF